jgi:hypothetical protein
MDWRIVWPLGILLTIPLLGFAQSPSAQVDGTELRWRAVGGAVSGVGGAAQLPSAASDYGLALVSGQGDIPASLPSDNGQVWRQYDIRSFTEQAGDVAKPEQAIVDWILRETGTEVWFSDPPGLLSANRAALRVYHTPEMHAVVSDTVARFVHPQAQKLVFGVRMVTMSNPNWRSKAFSRMQSVPVQSPGVEAWLLSREDAAIVIEELRKRTDFREHSSPNLLIRNGHTHRIARTRPLAYLKGPSQASTGYQMNMGQVEEGFWLTLSPLLAVDQQTADAVVKLETTQLERLASIEVPVPSAANPRQMAQIQVPQTSSWRLHERFRWPADQVLLISCGVVATPAPERLSVMNAPGLLANRPPRADALVFLQTKGRIDDLVSQPESGPRPQGLSFRGRY